MQSTTSAEPLHVLVVDDDSSLIRTLADILRLHGYSPSTALSGREGLALAERRTPALAVVDLRLPDMDGTELASRLHALSELTEVVVLTGNASVESAVAALREHSVDYLLKPVDVDQLLHVASLATERWQRRQAEERLRASDERFRRVVESDMLGLMFWKDEAVHDANDAFLRMTGYTREDLESGAITLPSLTPGAFLELDGDKRIELAEKGITRPYETEYRTKAGDRVPVLIGAATLRGGRDGGVAFVLDITDRKVAQRGLEARARQQAAVVALGELALSGSQADDLLTEAVRLVAQTLDLPVTAVFERRADGSALVLRAGVGWSASAIGKASLATSPRTQAGYALANAEAIVTDGDRDPRFIDGESGLLRDHGVASGVTVVIPGMVAPYGVLAAHDRIPREFTRDDVHFLQAIAHILGSAVDRARTEAAFRQSQRLEAVGRLASGVSHDFNNILTAITAYASMVRQGLSPSDPLVHDVDEILKAAGSAAGLTRQLLAFSRQQVLRPRLVMLNDVIAQMERMLRPVLGTAIEFRAALRSDIGLVTADPSQLEQVIVNLCVNARDAMPDGGALTIETANIDLDRSPGRDRPSAAPGPYTMLAVTDTGIGMDAETQARMFEPFFTTKTPDKGTGLGLATVYGIVKQSGGEIWVMSEPNFGTTFKIFLPHADI